MRTSMMIPTRESQLSLFFSIPDPLLWNGMLFIMCQEYWKVSTSEYIDWLLFNLVGPGLEHLFNQSDMIIMEIWVGCETFRGFFHQQCGRLWFIVYECPNIMALHHSWRNGSRNMRFPSDVLFKFYTGFWKRVMSNHQLRSGG